MWNELLLNDKPLVFYYSHLPELNDVNIHKIILDRDGPNIFVYFDLAKFPDRPPLKWDVMSWLF